MVEQETKFTRAGRFSSQEDTDELVANLEKEYGEGEAEFARRSKLAEGAIAFVHFDPTTAQSNIVDALVHYEDLQSIDRGLYVLIHSVEDERYYSGRIVEGPFYDPDALKRDATPVQFIILNQGIGKVLSLPEYHGRISIEILGEERNGTRFGAVRRPRPGSPVKPYDTTMMKDMLNLRGNVCLGLLDNYENTFVLLDEKAKGVIPRNWMTVGTIGSGKSNTNQVFIEETLAAGFAQVVVDPEGEYIFMDRPSDAKGIADELARFGRVPQGVKKLTVYRPPLSVSKRKDAIEFSVPFDTLSPEMIMELTEMNSTQQNRFASLYERAVECLRKKNRDGRLFNDNELDISQGYPGIRLITLNRMLRQELDYYNWKKGDSNKSKTAGSSARRKKSEKMTNGVEEIGTDDVEPQEMKIYCHEFGLLPLISDYNDASSYGALSKKLIALSRTRIFDRNDARPLDIERLCQPGHLSVIDMSDCGGQQIINIIIADLLTRLYRHKIKMEVQENEKHKVILTIEEAHGFVSRERQDKMVQTLDQLRRIARRGRKRWLCLHLVTQSPQHLPAELFELANNKIIHQMTGSENLRVLKAAAGSINEGIWENVPSLGVGRAVVIVSGQYPHPLITRIRRAASMRHYDH